MRNKVIIENITEFAAKYPHLVTSKPDNRKIIQAVRLGFPLEGVQVVPVETKE